MLLVRCEATCSPGLEEGGGPSTYFSYFFITAASFSPCFPLSLFLYTCVTPSVSIQQISRMRGMYTLMMPVPRGAYPIFITSIWDFCVDCDGLSPEPGYRTAGIFTGCSGSTFSVLRSAHAIARYLLYLPTET